MKAIFFDLDDTLLWDEKSVKKAFELTCGYAASKYDIDVEGLEQAVRESARELYSSYDTFSFTQMIGINPFEGLWGHFNDPGPQFNKMKEIVPAYRRDTWTQGLKKIGIDDPLLGEKLGERFPEERKKVPFLFDDALTVLGELQGKYKLLMLTNGSPELQNTKLTITPELTPFFDEIIISGEFGKGKPDRAIFDYALKVMDVNARDTLMVGDNLNTDILGANETGITSVWLNRFNREENHIQPDYEIEQLMELFPLLDKLE
ncbi:HAD family hydrolase [Salipaludibacillus sp. LMS25]|jgi:putative hydrolase of the HAD superfamily|uniref:HAD family hydrolase n=1 Tax=Salipaludibacillus sp. LMS25 TaxID=2924031 RepID=UPI0020D1513F|nr:HAD family hydrolase [Salipaludibacillus sp. LMS25]UTR15731.1 HAD family hydrolase [Salipaludibacillus sp. LMS25]